MVSVLELNKKIAAMMEPSNYISNMQLPERVNATRHQPLGPDCIISSKEIIDQTILTTVQYYWYISHEKGCVECVVKKSLTGEVTTQDPKCVVTRKNRRFEAYCCTLCRLNFVTVVQALLHLKAAHRPNNKIVIQDKDVFHNIEKAMEVPPVPLPWHIAKKVIEPGKLEDINNGEQPPTFVIPPGAIPIDQSTLTEAVPTMQQQQVVAPVNEPPRQTSPVPPKEKAQEKQISADTGQESNPMLGIILALVKEFKKHITALTFNDLQHEVNITFVDESKVVAKAPDLFVEAKDENTEDGDDDDAPLLFFVTEIEESKKDHETEYVTLKANNPMLARSLLKDALQRGLAVSSDMSSDRKEVSVKSEPSVGSDVDSAEQNSPLPSSIADSKTKSSTNRRGKSVRFTLGSPDSSDDEDPRTPTMPATVKESDEKQEVKTREGTFDGLRNVVDDLITTASKGRLIPLPPTSPLTTSAPHPPFISPTSLPLVGSSPALSNMVSFDGSSMLPRSSGTLTRNQSWTPSAAGTSFSVASIRRPYTARGFTYAEKIELMKQQNDYDTEFLDKHIRKTAASTKTTTSGQNNYSPLEVAKRKVAEGLGKQRRGRKPGQGRRKQSQRESTSSDSDPPVTEHSSTGGSARLQESTRHRRHRNHSTDSDDSPPTLVRNAANTMTGFHLLQNQLMGANFPTTDYYGSGEWATAAMETLKNLQSTMESRVHDQESVNRNMSHDEKLTNHVRSLQRDKTSGDENKPAKGESLSDGDDYSSYQHLKVKLPSSRKRCKSNELKTILDEGDVETKRVKQNNNAEETNDFDSSEKVTSAMKYLNRGNLSGKHGISPLLSEKEQNKVKSLVGGSTTDGKEQKPLPFELVRQKKLMGQKCSSDPALSSSASFSIKSESALPRISEEPKRKDNLSDVSDEKFARCGDHLVFTEDVGYNDLAADDRTVVMKLQSHTSSSSATVTDNIDSNIPEVFRNCIDTYAKVQLLQKLHVCKVCGFSVPANDSPLTPGGSSSGEKLLRAHVMEHSLKELYETGHTIGQW